MDRAPEDAHGAGPESGHYELRLYVTGMTARSTQAVAVVKAVCEAHLEGRYDLEVIDVYQQPQRASEERIQAVPTLIRKLPLPLRRLTGNLADTARVLAALDLETAADGAVGVP